MKLRFDPDLSHQRQALDAVVGLFAGQVRMPLAQAVTENGVVANRLDLTPDVLLERLQAVQAREGLPLARALQCLPKNDSGSFPNYCVEMETGTGKTYVYLRTALELGVRHGLRKYIVVVPSLAIREGVLNTLETTRSHFAGLYPRIPVRFARYDPRRMDEVREFAQSGALAFLIVTLDALNKQSNLVHRPNDRLQGMAPVELLQATRPILILDEPQNMESSRSRETLAALHPLVALRYSATHRRTYALVHRLTPRQAQAQGLVKTVRVKGGLDHHDPSTAWSRRIEETIREHLALQRRVRARGIKVLSLFFVERVDDYVGEGAALPILFDRHFERLRMGHPEYAGLPGAAVRAAYFAQRGDRAVDSRSGQAAEDEAAYRLIMQSKERLLSFAEPVAFIFSHSALREGWDNPNVFQICSLAKPKSVIKKRQEIGRGLRLAVDQDGRRIVDPEVNVLTLLVGEDHAQWWHEFQAEQEEAGMSLDPSTYQPAADGADTESRLLTGCNVTQGGWVQLNEAFLCEQAAALLCASSDIGSPARTPGTAAGPAGAVVDHVQRALRRRSPALVVPRRFIAAVASRVGAPLPSADRIESAIATVLGEALHADRSGRC